MEWTGFKVIFTPSGDESGGVKRAVATCPYCPFFRTVLTHAEGRRVVYSHQASQHQPKGKS